MKFDRINVDEKEVEKLGKLAELALELKPYADRMLVDARRKAPDWLVSQGYWYTRAGVSRRGAFAQAIVQHPGAIGAEYGGRKSRAFAMFRSSIR